MKKSIRIFVFLFVITMLPGWFQVFSQVFGSNQELQLISLTSAQSRIPVDTENGTKDVFVSGMNLAWIDFANDIADSSLDVTKLRKSIQDLRDAGGNAMRWWLFTNAAYAPKFDSDNLVSELGTKSIENVVKALDIAQENGVVVSLCLLSFDLLQKGSDNYWEFIIDRNKKMITTDEGIQALIDNAIIPLVQSVGDHPAILTWEIFNEPEGMTQEFGWTSEKVSMIDVQKMINRIAGAIHGTETGIPVSIGSHSMYASSDVPDCANCKNYYSDAELIAAGGKQNGILDFMQVHFYPEHFEDDRNPFAHPALYWNIGKPIVIGEFPAGDWNSGEYSSTAMTNKEAFRYAYSNGYAGAMSWDMNGFEDGVNPSYVQNLETSAAGLGYLWENHQEDILIKEDTRSDTDTFLILNKTSPNYTITSASDLQVYGTAAANHLTIESGAKAELFYFPGQNSIQFQSSSDMFTVSRSGAVVTFQGSDETILKIPATKNIQTISFNGEQSKVLQIHDNQVKLDDQVITTIPAPIENDHEEPGSCGAYIAPGVWKEFDCYNLAAIGKETGADPFTPSWELIGGYWQWGRKGPDSSNWYNTNTEYFAHGPTGPGESESLANSDSIPGWVINPVDDSAWGEGNGNKTDKDPCPKGFRVPTIGEWQAVLNDSVNNPQWAAGTWSADTWDDFTNYGAARFFGEKLMLPAAGYRNHTGELRYRGVSGYYWSSSEQGDYDARLLLFNSGSAHSYELPRLTGGSVRCIADTSDPLKIMSTVPVNNARNVPQNTSWFSVTFNNPMQGGYSVSNYDFWRFGEGNENKWSEDMRTYSVSRSNADVPLPPNTTIEMILNPDGYEHGFIDIYGNILPTTTIRFTTE